MSRKLFGENYYFIWYNKSTKKYEARSHLEIGGNGYRCPQYGIFETRYQAENKADELNEIRNNE